MGILTAVRGFLGDGFVGRALDFINKRWPADMSEEQRQQMELVISQAMHEQQVELLEIAAKQDEEFNKRVRDLEGTASDLKSLPIFGTLVIFLRGTQRPIWGFATLYLNFIWFTTETNWTQQQSTAMIIINLIVLGFLFGERTIKNLEPLIIKVFGK